MSFFLTPVSHRITERSEFNLCLRTHRMKRWGWNIPCKDRVGKAPLVILLNTANKLFAVENPSVSHELFSPTHHIWLRYKEYRGGVEVSKKKPQSWVQFPTGTMRLYHKGHFTQGMRIPSFTNPDEPRIARVGLEVIPNISSHKVPGMDGRWHYALYLVPDRWYFVYDFGNEFVIAYR